MGSRGRRQGGLFFGGRFLGALAALGRGILSLAELRQFLVKAFDGRLFLSQDFLDELLSAGLDGLLLSYKLFDFILGHETIIASCPPIRQPQAPSSHLLPLHPPAILRLPAFVIVAGMESNAVRRWS